MSDDDDDLFADSDASDDTADLIQQSTEAKKEAVGKKKSAGRDSAFPSRLKKKAPAGKKKAPPNPPPKAAAALRDSDSSDDDGKGLFDSDSDDSDNDAEKKASSDSANKRKKPMSKRERLEALARSKRAKEGTTTPLADRKQPPKDKEKEGYESGDSYDSADFQRTAEDDDFLDTTGEDAEAVQELYAEQNFDDERPDREEKAKKKRKIRHDRGTEEPGEGAGDDGGGEPDNPIMAAVHRMKKKRREKKSFTDLEDEGKAFLARMEMAAENDEFAVAERRPATNKLSMLTEVSTMLARRDIQRVLLDLELLSVCKRWIQPLPNGTLGNVTVRQRLIQSIQQMSGETGITAEDLKRSEFGKVVMTLAMHRDETPAMKRTLKKLVEQWSRPIFQKSGNMRDLDRVQRGEVGLAALARQSQQAQARAAAATAASGGSQDLDSLIQTGKRGGDESGIQRVRVPFSKGFAYSVRPAGRFADGSSQSPAGDKRGRGGSGGGVPAARGNLSKRMVEKGRTVSKSQRSANISIEGRKTK